MSPALNNVSFLVLTLNEEQSLPGCLDSIRGARDVVVLDSGSTDGTEEIARAAGARFFRRDFDNYSSHRNWGLSEITYPGEWVFALDADERLTHSLSSEIATVTEPGASDGVAAFAVRFKNMLWGQWIRRSSLYPTWVTRLYRPDRVRYEQRPVHAHLVVDGDTGRLKEHFIHYGFSKGLHQWFDRHNRYSTMEMQACLQELRSGRIDWKGLRSVNPGTKRRALKNLSFRLPCRPMIKFAYYYLYRGGIMEGASGFTYCTLQAIYEYMIVLKLREIRRRELGLPI